MELSLIVVLFFFGPMAVAISRRHKNRYPIILVNLFLGWTVIGWFIALVWAWTDNVDESWETLHRKKEHERKMKLREEHERKMKLEEDSREEGLRYASTWKPSPEPEPVKRKRTFKPDQSNISF